MGLGQHREFHSQKYSAKYPYQLSMIRFFKICLAIAIITFSALSAHAAMPDLSDYDAMLNDHVMPDQRQDRIQYNAVDYDAWANDPRHDQAMQSITDFDPARLSSRAEKLSFWINAYNLLTIDLIIDQDERNSIKDIGNIFTNPWQDFNWNIGEKKVTLDQIEHDIIRPMGEERIHFAINCAAISCPDLRTTAYTPGELDAQLSDQVQKTLANSTKGLRIDGNTVYVSKIFDWFAEDFNNSNVKTWIVKHSDRVSDEMDLDYLRYDWSLNKPPARE